MNVHQLYSRISPFFRNRRFRLFLTQIRPSNSDRILDVGGHASTWAPHEPVGASIELVNTDLEPIAETVAGSHHMTGVHGDACALPYVDQSFDILFSNSVIEHVGDWQCQQAFAREARRVGRKLWIQTPAREFFIEPHYIGLFVHWLPKTFQPFYARWFTVWGLLHKPSRETLQARIDEIRLLTIREMRELFPDCQILREKFLFLLTKSYVAYRNEI